MLMMNTGHTQVGPAVARLVADLRARHRQQEPARLRRALPGRADHRRAAAVEQRVPAGGAPGHVHRRQGREADRDAIVGKDFDPKKLDLVHPQRQVHARPSSAASSICWRSSTGCSCEREPVHDPQLEAAIQSMETAYRMQTEAPEVFDIRKESEATLEAVRPRQHGARLPDGGAPGRARRAHGAGLLRQGRSVGRARATSRRTARTPRIRISRSPR